MHPLKIFVFITLSREKNTMEYSYSSYEQVNKFLLLSSQGMHMTITIIFCRSKSDSSLCTFKPMFNTSVFRFKFLLNTDSDILVI
jgi:hypothetical protein